MLSKGKSTRGVKSHHMNHFTRLVTKHLEEKGFIKEADLIESNKQWLRKYFEFENAELTLSKTRAAELIKSLYNQEKDIVNEWLEEALEEYEEYLEVEEVVIK